MLRQIDHIVIVVRDLARASADFAASGFTVTPGGEHVGGETHNALISFADGTYFEVIAFKEPDRPHEHKWWSCLTVGEGLVDYALGSTDLAADAGSIRSRGLPMEGPIDGGRRRPDGQRLEWRTILAGRGVKFQQSQPSLPFVIEDLTPRELRVPGSQAAQHRLPVSRVAGLTLLTADLDTASASMAALFGVDGRHQTASTGRSDRAVRYSVGAQWLELVQPAIDSSAARQYLGLHGDGPYEVVLSREAAEPGAGELLDPRQLHGARIRIAD